MKVFGFFITLLVYYTFSRLFEKSDRKFYLNPVLLSILFIAIFLEERIYPMICI